MHLMHANTPLFPQTSASWGIFKSDLGHQCLGIWGKHVHVLGFKSTTYSYHTPGHLFLGFPVEYAIDVYDLQQYVFQF